MSPHAGSKRGQNGWRLPPEAISLLKRAIDLRGRERVAQAAGLQDRTLRRAVDGCLCSRSTYHAALRYAAQWMLSEPGVFRVTEGT
jgi:hypothetical protein